MGMGGDQAHAVHGKDGRDGGGVCHRWKPAVQKDEDAAAHHVYDPSSPACARSKVRTVVVSANRIQLYGVLGTPYVNARSVASTVKDTDKDLDGALLRRGIGHHRLPRGDRRRAQDNTAIILM